MGHIKKLIGKHIYLSPHTPEDAEPFYRWRNDLSLTQLLGSPTRLSSLESELEGIRTRNSGSEHHFSILTLAENRLIGYCGMQGLSICSISLPMGGYFHWGSRLSWVRLWY